jgi:transcriptional regulator with XRE-family HTH domain
VKHPVVVKAFGTHLRYLRNERQLSQEKLAELADVAKNTIQRIESAKFSVTIDVLYCLAIGLKLPLCDLLDFNISQEQRKLS